MSTYSERSGLERSDLSIAHKNFSFFIENIYYDKFKKQKPGKPPTRSQNVALSLGINS